MTSSVGMMKFPIYGKKDVPNFHQSVFVWPFLTHRPTIRPGYPSTLSLRAVIWHRPTLKDASWSLRREKPRTKWGGYSKPCLMTPEGIILISWFIYLESSVYIYIYMCNYIYIYIMVISDSKSIIIWHVRAVWPTLETKLTPTFKEKWSPQTLTRTPMVSEGMKQKKKQHNYIPWFHDVLLDCVGFTLAMMTPTTVIIYHNLWL